MLRGVTKVLQFKVNMEKFVQGRLNPHIPLAQAGDCSSNSLFLLDQIGEEIAIDLSTAQTHCRATGTGITALPEFFLTYLFDSISSNYEILQLNREQLMQKVEELARGNGTVLTMNEEIDGVLQAGHTVVIQRNEYNNIELIDLQNQRVIPRADFDQYFETYRYNSFKIPSIQKKRTNESESITGKKIRTAGRRKNRKTRRKRTRKN